MIGPQVTRTLKVTPLLRWFTRKYDSRPAARTVTTHVMDANSISLPLRQPPYPSAQQQPIRLAISRAPTCARLFLLERDGRV